MKKLVLLSVLIAGLLIIRVNVASPAKSVFHAHAGRIHNHVLPVEGVSHRHNGSERGVIAKSTNWAPQITSTVVYGSKPIEKPVPKPKIGSSTRQIPSVRHFQNEPYRFPKEHSQQEYYQQAPQQTPPPRPNRTLQAPIRYNSKLNKGDIRCRTGEEDCNVCASNVQQQFQKAKSGQINWRTKPWRFTWPQSYPPYNKRPLDIFDGDPAYALGIPDTHIQGFVRTNSARFPYAGSHSHKRQGGVFVIRQTNDGKKYLSSLHPTQSKHPSGVHVLGKYLVYGEKNNLFFKDLNSPNQKNSHRLSVQNANFGGGLGLLRLAKDSYLLVTTGPGGQDSRPRFNRFYHLRGSNGRPTSLTYISQSPVKIGSGWSRSFGFSENLSLITECGTGDVYAVNTSGDEKGIKAVSGNGYWRLSKLKEKYGSLSFEPINAFSSRQNMSSCNVRAAATVFVNSRHTLEFYCHGYAKDPSGSTFNVLGSSSSTHDKFNFKVGVVR